MPFSKNMTPTQLEAPTQLDHHEASVCWIRNEHSAPNHRNSPLTDRGDLWMSAKGIMLRCRALIPFVGSVLGTPHDEENILSVIPGVQFLEKTVRP